jgi:hypothetical protein
LLRLFLGKELEAEFQFSNGRPVTGPEKEGRTQSKVATVITQKEWDIKEHQYIFFSILVSPEKHFDSTWFSKEHS